MGCRLVLVALETHGGRQNDWSFALQPADLDVWRNQVGLFSEERDPRKTGDYLPVDEEDRTPLEVEDILLLGRQSDNGSGGGVEEFKEDPPTTDEEDQSKPNKAIDSEKRIIRNNMFDHETAFIRSTTTTSADRSGIPILPDSQLWDAHYDSDGEISEGTGPLMDFDPPSVS